MKHNDFELLLPVGQYAMAEAAIHNGADAIFLGFPGFNARGRSYDFEIEELKKIIELCHLYSVKVNLAFNIVIFENELVEVVKAIKEILPLKPDALIIQDLGLIRLVKSMCPEQVIHGSTQMTVTNDLAIDCVSDLDIKRFVLGRENSLNEIKLIAENTKKDLEVFVHGALCVSYSGQCFTSETLGGRSANRGQCAQSCRFSYDLIVDGEKKETANRNYLVSPQDLCGLSEIPELMRLGVKSFKVEGRLKSPEFVAQVAKSFRQVIDATIDKKTISERFVESLKNAMQIEYSRGFFSGWLHGVNHQKLVDGTFSSHRGLEIGRIRSIDKSSLKIELNNQADIENGDGLLWFEGESKNGGSVYSIHRSGQHIECGFSNQLKISDLALGSKIYLNHDKSQKKDIEKSMTDKLLKKKIPIKVSVSGQLGQSLSVHVFDDRFSLSGKTESVLSAAQNRPLTKELLFEEFNSLSQTVFTLSPDDFVVEEHIKLQSLFLNHKEIKQLRQKLYHDLEALRAKHKISNTTDTQISDSSILDIKSRKVIDHQNLNKLTLLLRSKEQVNDFILGLERQDIQSKDIESVCLDFEFGRDYQVSIEKLKSAQVKTGLATTRILKPQEYNNLKIIGQLNPDFVLVRNLGAIEYFKKNHLFENRIRGDFSLNVTNRLTFDYLIDKKLNSLCLSYDLNADQIKDILHNIDSSRAEITIHQFMPSFHMEHCVFAAFLSKGSSFKDCGKPCEKHKVQLKDQFGHMHWIKPDQECRNTMYNASAQTALPYLKDWKNLGLGFVRYEALNENNDELILKIKTYCDVINERLSIDEAVNTLSTTAAYGLSARQLAKDKEYQARKKDHSFLK